MEEAEKGVKEKFKKTKKNGKGNMEEKVTIKVSEETDR